eukprot:scaffold65790_cov31-Prasinocladus_malaysianus.AAC.1
MERELRRSRRPAPAIDKPCYLCGANMARKARKVPAEMTEPYNRLLSNVQGLGLPAFHEIPAAWALAESQGMAVIKALPAIPDDVRICQPCYAYDTKQMAWDRLTEGQKSERLPRYWKEGCFRHFQEQKPSDLCIVCCALGDVNPEAAMYSVKNYGPDLLAYFFNLLHGVEFPFVGGNRKELCSTHFQHFQKQPLHKQQICLNRLDGKPWIGWMWRKCVICDSSHREQPDAAWHLAAGLSDKDRDRLLSYLGEDIAISHAGVEDAELTLPTLGRLEWICGCCWAQHRCQAPSYVSQPSAGSGLDSCPSPPAPRVTTGLRIATLEVMLNHYAHEVACLMPELLNASA